MQEFKEKVILFLETYGIDTLRLDIRAFQQFGGDVRIYVDKYFELVNKKSSFRKEKAVKNQKGEIIGYEGTRGHHVTKRADPIIFNRDDWDEMLENKYKTWDFIYKELDKLKQ